MTDDDLLHLIQERPANEWTTAEVEAVRQRWPKSPVLQQALSERLEMDGHLAGSLATIEITVQTILERAQKTQSLARRKRAAGILGPLGFMLLLIGLGYGIYRAVDEGRLFVGVDLGNRPTPEVTPTDLIVDAENLPADALEVVSAAPETPVVEVADTSPPQPVPVPTPPKVEPEPEPAGPLEPWTAAYALKGPVLKPDADVLRADFPAAGHEDFPEEEARRWWTNAGSQAFNWGQDAVVGKRIARFQGTAKLRAPWRDDTLLRMTVLDSAALELFFWRGKDGVSLRYYTAKEPHVWAAYRVTREDVASPAAKRVALLTTDSGAFFRSTPGTFDLQVQNGRLILARGSIPLLTVPVGGVPEEVLLEGQCRLRGMTVHKSEPLPLPEENPHPVAFGGDQAVARWDWKPIPDTSPIVTAEQPGGGVKFTVDARDKPGLVSAAISRPGLYEVIFRIDEAEPGTAISLGTAQGKPLVHLAVLREQKTQQLAFGVLYPGEVRETADFDATQLPVAFFAPGQWVRMVAGLGTLQVWTSGDRLHWGHLPQNPIRDMHGPVTSIGVMGLHGATPRSITLGHLEVRELSGLTAFADPVWMGRVPAFSPEEMRDITLWMHRALEAHPAGAETDRWLNTCAIHTLERGPQREFGLALLKRLLDGASQTEGAPQPLIAALHDSALLMDLWDERQALQLAEPLQTVGLRLLDRGVRQPSRMMRSAWLRMPVWTVSSAKSVFDRLANRELTGAVSRGEWALATAMAQESRFWNVPPLPNAPLLESAVVLDRLATWVRAVATEQQPGLAAADSALPLAWRHPFVQQVNKEGYNLRAELDAALQGEAYDDACRLVTTLGDSLAEGLLPDLRDRQLFVTMPTAILSAQREHPEFAKAMNREHGQSGLVRVRQAIADRDRAVIQSATVQLLGTPAAAEAHRWLGDQLLATGKFSDAEAQFRFALDSANVEQTEQLRPRLRLAAAWSGKTLSDFGDKFPPGGLDLNGFPLTAAAFEALLEEARVRSQTVTVAGTGSSRKPAPAVPAGYKLDLKAQFDGHPGNNPGRAEYRFGDPFGKQLSFAFDDQNLYVSNRFQTNAYLLQTGAVRWAQGVGSEQGEAYDFPFVPMRPLVHQEFVFVRRLTRAGVELCCLKRADGVLVWKQRPMSHVLTDPMLWQGELCALVGGKVEDDQLQVEFARFDLATGMVLSTKPVMRFRDIWNQAIPCRWSIGDRWAVCQIGPITACLTPSGDLRWLRKPTWLPGPVDDLVTDGRGAEPFLVGDRLVQCVPGSRSIDGIDVPTGRLLWRTPVPEVRGLRGVTAHRAVVDVGEGLMGLDLANGDIVWKSRLNGVLESWAMDDQMILCARRGSSLTPQHRPCLVWLDAVTGRELAQTQLDAVDREEWQLGPMVAAGGKWWLLGGTGWKDHKRELLELVTVSATAPAPFANNALRNWAPELTDAERTVFSSVLPAWWPASDYKSRWQFVPGDLRGENRLLISRTGENQQPTWLTSRLEVPAEASSLHFRVANQPGQKWRLMVRIDDQLVLDRVLEDVSTNGNWQDVAVDLSPFAGRSTLATAMHGPVDGQPSEALWKRIDLLKN